MLKYSQISHMECWVSKKGKKGALSSFMENIQKLRFWF